MLKGISNKMSDIRKYYILFFLSWLLLTRIVPFVKLIDGGGFSINSLIYNLLAMFGCVYILLDLLTKRTLFKAPIGILLLAFVAVIGISSLINIKYGWTDNFKTIVWTMIHLFVMFSLDYSMPKEKVKAELRLFGHTILLLNVIPVVISLIQFFLNISYVEPYQQYDRNQGFVQGRLYGIFTDPNYAAVIACIAILISVYFIFHYRKKWYMVALNIINIIIQAPYIILTGSRTAMVVGVIMMIVAIIAFLNKEFARSGDSRQRVIALVAALALFSTIVLMYEPAKTVLMDIKSYVSGGSDVVSPPNQGQDPNGGGDDGRVGSDISNLRFEIWETGFKIFGDKPLFGVSPRNIPAYCEEVYPDSIILRSSKHYTGVHSVYVGLLANSGILGTVSMLGFMSIGAFTIIKVLLKKREDYIITACCFIALVAIAVQGVFCGDIVFTNLTGGVIFWCAFGYGLYFVKDEAVLMHKLSIEAVYKAVFKRKKAIED